VEGSPRGSRRVRFDASFVRREWNVRGDIPEDSERGKQSHLKLLLLLTIIILSYAPLFTLLVIITLSLFFFTARLRRRRRVLLCSKEREREESFLKTALKKTTV